MKKSVSEAKRDSLIGAAIVAVCVILCLFTSDAVVDFMCKVVIMMLFASSLNIILGFGGLRPLGHATFFGIGGYAYVVFAVRGGLSLGASLVLSLLIAFVSAWAIGYLTLKTGNDIAFAFMNMGINILLWTMAQKIPAVGSDTGLAASVRFSFAQSSKANFLLCLLVCTVCIIMIYLFFKTPFASVLQGSRENDERLLFLGINTRNIRLIAYVIAGMFAAVAGILYSMRNMGAYPTMLSSNTSTEGLIMCLIGGMYSFFGPILGAAIETAISTELPILTQYYQAVLGLIVVLCVLFLQGGLLRKRKTVEPGVAAGLGSQNREEAAK
jgi:ABC-type branched-chain amino acid transport system, permease component